MSDAARPCGAHKILQGTKSVPADGTAG